MRDNYRQCSASIGGGGPPDSNVRSTDTIPFVHESLEQFPHTNSKYRKINRKLLIKALYTKEHRVY